MTARQMILKGLEAIDDYCEGCDLPEKEGNTGACCKKHARRILKQYEKEIIKKYKKRRKTMENYGEKNCGKNCRDCEWYGTCPHSYHQFDAERGKTKDKLYTVDITMYEDGILPRGKKVFVTEEDYVQINRIIEGKADKCDNCLFSGRQEQAEKIRAEAIEEFVDKLKSKQCHLYNCEFGCVKWADIEELKEKKE